MSKSVKTKRVNVEIAPAVMLALQEEKQKRNSAIDKKTSKITYTDIINEALDRFLPAFTDQPKE